MDSLDVSHIPSSRFEVHTWTGPPGPGPIAIYGVTVSGATVNPVYLGNGNGNGTLTRGSGGNDDMSWTMFCSIAAIIVFLIELVVCIRQWRLKSTSVNKNDTTRGKVAYNAIHSLLSTLRVWILLNYELVPQLWTKSRNWPLHLSQFHHTPQIHVPIPSTAFTPSTPPTASGTYTPSIHFTHYTHFNHYTHSVLFVLICAACYLLLHVPDFIFYLVLTRKNPLTNLLKKWTPRNVIRTIAKGESVHVVFFLIIVITLIAKIFVSYVKNILIISIAIIQLLFIILYPLLSQPRMKDLALLTDEKAIAAIKELTAEAKFPLKGIYVSDEKLVDRDIAEHGVKVCGWPRKSMVVVNARVLEEFTSEDLSALLAYSLTSWKGAVEIRFLVVTQMTFANALTVFLLLSTSPDNPATFGFPAPTIRDNIFPFLAALICVMVSLGRPWAMYLGIIARAMRRKMTWETDKQVSLLGHSIEFSAVLTKLSLLPGTNPAEARNDLFYSLTYNSRPLLSERLAWLEVERVREESKEGVIRLEGGELKL